MSSSPHRLPGLCEDASAGFHLALGRHKLAVKSPASPRATGPDEGINFLPLSHQTMMTASFHPSEFDIGEYLCEINTKGTEKLTESFLTKLRFPVAQTSPTERRASASWFNTLAIDQINHPINPPAWLWPRCSAFSCQGLIHTPRHLPAGLLTHSQGRTGQPRRTRQREAGWRPSPEAYGREPSLEHT